MVGFVSSFFIKTTFFIWFLFSLSACFLDARISSKIQEGLSSSTDSIVPTAPSITISSAKTLYVSSTSSLGLFTHNYTTIAPTDLSQAPALGVTFTGTGSALSTALATANTTPPASANSAGSTSISGVDESYSINVSSSQDISAWLCEVFSSSLLSSCSGSTINISASTLASSQKLFLKYTQISTSLTASSNELNVNGFRIRQISNTRGNQTISDAISNILPTSDKLFFVGTNSSGQANRLFSVDPATSEIRQVMTAPLYFSAPNSPFLGLVSGKLMFWGTNGSSNAKMFSFDGSNLIQVSNSANNQTSNDVFSGALTPVNVGGNLYFLCIRTGTGRLCKYDGTTLSILTNAAGATHDIASVESSIYVVGTKLIFKGQTTSSYYLYSYDTTSGVFTKLISTNLGSGAFSLRGPIGGFYFLNGGSDDSLIATNDFVNFSIVSDTNGGGADTTSISTPDNEMDRSDTSKGIAGGKLIFNASNSNSVYRCYTYDGTEVRALFNNLPAATNEPCLGDVYNGKAYVSGTNSNGAFKLFRYDGTELRQISNTRGNETANDSPRSMAYFDNTLYFRSLNSAGFEKLFLYDGTNVVQVSNTNPAGSDNPTLVRKLGNFIYFTSKNSSGVLKLYRMCSLSSADCTD